MLSPIAKRYAFVGLFVTVYISLGFLLKLEAISYLLLGIPLTLIFQLLVAKQPLHKLWLRDGETFQLNKLGFTITFCFLVFPIYKTSELAYHNQLTLLHLGYNSAAILGAFGAGYCCSNFRRKTIRNFFTCFGLIALFRMSWYFFPFIIGNPVFDPDLIQSIESLLTYIPVAFVVEEVVFRGMLDTYVHRSKETNELGSAIYISCMWGLWHLPLSTNTDSLAILSLLIRAAAWGIFLSLFWRRSGNLAVPGFSHAFTDAIRDSLK